MARVGPGQLGISRVGSKSSNWPELDLKLHISQVAPCYAYVPGWPSFCPELTTHKFMSRVDPRSVPSRPSLATQQ